MATISDKQFNIITSYYQEGKSVREISEKLNTTIDAVYYFFRKNNIPRRSPKENNELQFKRKKATFQVKNNLSNEEEILRVSGVMLYWAEGSKWPGEVIVDFANSDSVMIKIFLDFLRRICRIDEEKLRAFLYCYDNQDVKGLLNFWSRITKIPKKQFTKPYIKQSIENKVGKMKNGLVHIRYNDKKLLLLIRHWIKEFEIKYN